MRITAKHAGTCSDCGAAFPKGTAIRWYRNGSTYPIDCECKRQEGIHRDAYAESTYGEPGPAHADRGDGPCEDEAGMAMEQDARTEDFQDPDREAVL